MGNNTNKSVSLAHCSVRTFNNYNMIKEKTVTNVILNGFGAESCFKGRLETLKEIQEHFRTKTMVVICGAPGVGKTGIARRFIVQYSEDFKGNIIWIDAETPAKIKNSFEDLFKSLQIFDLSQVYGKFRSSRCLIIFDNAENMASVCKYLPSSELYPTVNILITSQFSLWDESVAKVFLKPLHLKDALDIFRDKLNDKFDGYNIEIWENLVKYLEGFPLYVHIVSALVYKELCKKRIKKFNLEQFICNLKENFINLEIPKSEIFNYHHKTVLESIDSTLKRPNMVDSLNLLWFMAYLHAGRISDKDLLFVPSTKEPNYILEDALNTLENYSLIQLEECYDKKYLKIKIHQTFQLALRDDDLITTNGLTFETVLKTILHFNLFSHWSSVFKCVKKIEFENKSEKFYDNDRILANLFLVHLASYHCNGVLEKLLPKFKVEYIGINDTYYNKTLNEMLYKAINNKSNHLHTIKLLIKYGAKIEIPPDSKNHENGFHLASSWLSVELFDCLLESNDSKNIINSRDYFGRTILHLLVLNCHEEDIRTTVECMDHLKSKWKADISIQDDESNNLLHSACGNTHLCFEMIQHLVQNYNCRSLINTRNKWKKTPFQILLMSNYNSDLLEIASYFIEDCEADITISDKRQWNTLFYICRYGTSKIINFVLNTKTCPKFINNKDINEDVAFSQLIHNKSINEQEIIELLNFFIANEMDFKNRNKENKTLAEIAEEKEYMKLSVELKNHLEGPSAFWSKYIPRL